MLILILVISQINIVHSANYAKIDKKIIEKLSHNENVSVMIKFKETNQRKINLENKVILIKNRIRHKFDNSVSATISAKDLAYLERNSQIKSITILGTKNLFLENSVSIVNATPTWALQIKETNITGAGQTACILDTGADFTHPDLLGKNLTCVIDCTNGCIENCSVGDFHGHGTHVAGIITSNGSLKGIAPGANLISIKVCPSESCANDDILAGIDWCITNAEQYNISVISMSLGGGQYDSYCDLEEPDFAYAINNATSKNISVIVATGNTDPTYNSSIAGIASPACIQNSTRVSATDDSDLFASFAFRHQNFTDILTAPGVNINSLLPNNAYDEKSGTSMSTPHVSGAFLLIRQFKQLKSNEILTTDEIKNSLVNYGVKIYDSLTNMNYTRINIYSSLLSFNNSINESLEINPIFPNNNFKTNKNNQSFLCNSSSSNELSNITFYLWNSSGLEHSEIKNISGIQNLSQFEYNLSYEGDYFWNCLVANQNNESYSSNFSIYYDLTKPEINLISPINAESTTSTIIDFQYNVTDNLGLESCSLIINNESVKTNQSEITNSTNTIQYSLSVGDYVWKINCTDEARNENNSSERTLTITLVPSPPSSSSGGGGGSSRRSSVFNIKNNTNQSEETIKKVESNGTEGSKKLFEESDITGQVSAEISKTYGDFFKNLSLIRENFWFFKKLFFIPFWYRNDFK